MLEQLTLGWSGAVTRHNQTPHHTYPYPYPYLGSKSHPSQDSRDKTNKPTRHLVRGMSTTQGQGRNC